MILLQARGRGREIGTGAAVEIRPERHNSALRPWRSTDFEGDDDLFADIGCRVGEEQANGGEFSCNGKANVADGQN
jgi:hypothetical protein